MFLPNFYTITTKKLFWSHSWVTIIITGSNFFSFNLLISYQQVTSFACVCSSSRFRQDAAVLLDILSVYQKRQVVEFLPYHYCDMNDHQSPDLKCVMTLQAQCTQYRHMILLTGTWSIDCIYQLVEL